MTPTKQQVIQALYCLQYKCGFDNCNHNEIIKQMLEMIE
jgi:hypothetical protein